MKYGTRSIDDIKMDLTAYAAERVARGLPGLPAHPKKGLIATVAISQETKINTYVLSLHEIKAHLADLAKRHGLADPVAERRVLAVETVTTHYNEKPLPWGRAAPHFSIIAQETGVHIKLVKSPEVRAALDALVKTNGTFTPSIDVAGEYEKFKAYETALLRRNGKIPFNGGRNAPDTLRLAQEIGVPAYRISSRVWQQRIKQLIDRFGREEIDTLDDELVRLEVYVARQIKAHRPVPRRDTGPAYLSIAEAIEATSHRLRSSPPMQKLITKWISACGLDSAPAPKKTRKKEP